MILLDANNSYDAHWAEVEINPLDRSSRGNKNATKEWQASDFEEVIEDSIYLEARRVPLQSP